VSLCSMSEPAREARPRELAGLVWVFGMGSEASRATAGSFLGFRFLLAVLCVSATCVEVRGGRFVRLGNGISFDISFVFKVWTITRRNAYIRLRDISGD
jgi:hypothetical protein